MEKYIDKTLLLILVVISIAGCASLGLGSEQQTYVDTASGLVYEYNLSSELVNGPCTVKDMDGNIVLQGNFKDGMRDGIWTKYEEGDAAYRITYAYKSDSNCAGCNNPLTAKAVLDGPFEVYHKGGSVCFSGQFSNNLKSGVWNFEEGIQYRTYKEESGEEWKNANIDTLFYAISFCTKPELWGDYYNVWTGQKDDLGIQEEGYCKNGMKTGEWVETIDGRKRKKNYYLQNNTLCASYTEEFTDISKFPTLEDIEQVLRLAEINEELEPVQKYRIETKRMLNDHIGIYDYIDTVTYYRNDKKVKESVVDEHKTFSSAYRFYHPNGTLLREFKSTNIKKIEKSYNSQNQLISHIEIDNTTNTVLIKMPLANTKSAPLKIDSVTAVISKDTIRITKHCGANKNIESVYAITKDQRQDMLIDDIEMLKSATYIKEIIEKLNYAVPVE